MFASRAALPRVLAVLACAATLAGALTGCSLFGGGGKDHKAQSVFSVTPGQCFLTPGKVQAELSSLQRTPCSSEHTREAYAIVPYVAAGPTAGTAGSAYPGADALSSFAKGACAQRFTSYVGVDYLDSTLFFTYLMPSARSWEQDDDRDVICFVTTAGAPLTASVKNSKR